MLQFREVEFPAMAKAMIRSSGGNPLRAFIARRGADCVSVLVSDDPSGDDGAVERHASIGAMTGEKSRRPTVGELTAALHFLEIPETAEVEMGRDVVHYYIPNTSHAHSLN
jgi:hypothetical protein